MSDALLPRPLAAIDHAACRESAELGLWHLRGFLTDAQQDAYVEAARTLKAKHPLVHPTMRSGDALSVRVSSFGARGWWADKEGYRYVEKHPTTRAAFPPLPDFIRETAAQALCAAAHYSQLCIPGWTAAQAWGLSQGVYEHTRQIDTCLVNHYGSTASLGWHIDKTELDLVSPIVTYSLGADATFELKLYICGETKTFRHHVRSGDAIVMAGRVRTAEHRVTDVRPAAQAELFGQTNYNPMAATAPGVRLSFTIRRTGFSR